MIFLTRCGLSSSISVADACTVNWIGCVGFGEVGADQLIVEPDEHRARIRVGGLVIGDNTLETGIKLLPISIAMIIAAVRRFSRTD